MNCNCKDDCFLVKELKSENTELKEKYVQNICDCDICDTYCNSQLIKAKELLKKAQGYTENLDDEADKLYDEIEQFLNSEVEK